MQSYPQKREKKGNRGEFQPTIVDNPQKNGRWNTIAPPNRKMTGFKKFIPHRCSSKIKIAKINVL